MPESTRAFFEPRFGYDFSQVRIHKDAATDSLARELGARAFTTGSDVFFREGAYSPESEAGKELLTHELTHVLQQKSSASAKLQRKPEDSKDSYLFIDDPEKVAEFEKEFVGSSAILTIAGRLTEVKSGTKFGKSTFIDRTGGKVYYKWKNTIRACSVAEFERGLELEVIAKRVYQSAAAIVPIAKYEALLVMVVLRPNLLLDIAGNIIQGKSPIDEDAMRGYLASMIFAPLGVKTASKVTNILVGDVIKPAAEEAFKQLAKEGKLKPDKYAEDVLISVFCAQVGKFIAALPADSERLLQSANDTLREVTGGLISKEIGAGVSVGKELAH